MEYYIASIYLFSFLFYLLACFFRPNAFARIAFLSLCLGFLGTLFLIAKHIFQLRRLPLTNTPETLLSLVTLAVFVFLILEYKKLLPMISGMLISLFSFTGLIFAMRLFRKPSHPLLPALQSKLLVFHVSSCIIAYSFFTIAFIATIINIIKRNSLGQDGLRNVIQRTVCIGFFFLTLGIILGSIWGRSAWGHWWNWDPKETWALISWLIYALYFYGKMFANLPDRILAAIVIAGFLFCIFTYLGVNFLLKGMHSYA